MQNSYSNFIGIDIGKAEIVSFVRNDDKANSYKNNSKGFKNFLNDNRAHLAHSLVVLETTYAYERQERLSFYQKVDKNQEELKLLIERRQDLKQMLTPEKNRFKAPLNKLLKPCIKVVIDCLDQQVNSIEESINKIIDDNKELCRKREILRTVPGMGP